MTNFKHNYVNIHLLTLYPFSNPNRDDMNRPKEMFFGDALRQRISSQSLKYAYRQSFDNISIRTRYLFVELFRSKHFVSKNDEILYYIAIAILTKMFDSKNEALIQLFLNNKIKIEKEGNKKTEDLFRIEDVSNWSIKESELSIKSMGDFDSNILDEGDNSLKHYLDQLFEELKDKDILKKIEGFITNIKKEGETLAILKTLVEDLLTKEHLINTKNKTKKTTKTKKDEDVEENSEDIDGLSEELDISKTDSESIKNLKKKVSDIQKDKILPIDIAFFGRMSASNAERNVEASISVSHAFSINPFTSGGEIDFFTAVDDLSNQGSGHLGEKYLASSVYYHCIVINKTILFNNLSLGRTDIKNEDIEAMIEQAIKDFLKTAIFHGALGMIASTCSYQKPDFVRITKSNTPMTGYSAFSQSIKNSDNLLLNGSKKLVNYLDNMKTTYSLDDVSNADMFNESVIPLDIPKVNLNDLMVFASKNDKE